MAGLFINRGGDKVTKYYSFPVKMIPIMSKGVSYLDNVIKLRAAT